MRYPALVCLTASLGLALPTHAADWIGAAAVLQRLSDAAADATGAPASDPIANLKTQLRDYSKSSDTLTPGAAAARWLALFDTFSALPSEALYGQTDYENRLSMMSLIEALPPASAWDELSAAIYTRTANSSRPRDMALRILGAALGQQTSAIKTEVDAFLAAINASKKLEDYERENLRSEAESVAEAHAETSGPQGVVDLFAKELARHEAPEKNPNRYLSSTVRVPDLVRLIGREAAEPLLLRVLRVGKDTDFTGQKTRQFAAELALQEIDRLPKPVWSLVQSTEDIALYEAFAKKFPAAGRDDARRSADVVYLFSLIANYRVDEATRLAVADPLRYARFSEQYGGGGIFAEMQRAGHGDAVVTFLHDCLKQDPALPFWSDYITVAARQSRAPESLALLREARSRPDLPPSVAEEIHARYTDALLAADETEEGVRLLRETVAALVANNATTPAADGEKIEPDAALDAPTEDDSRSARRERESGRYTSVTRLMQLGKLLDQPALTEEGLRAAQSLLQPAGNSYDYLRNHLFGETLRTLVDQNRAPEAEALVLDRLLKAQKNSASSRSSGSQEDIASLAWIYHRAGRHADVLRLFDESTLWGVADLSKLRDSRAGEDSPKITAADALIAAQRTDDARRILRRIIQDAPGSDAAYLRLEKLGGDDLPEFLARTFERDRYEERPLIWLARHQLAKGQVNEAETTLRSAIAIDPSDGEQGKGDRMRAYAVLADILDAKGDPQTAAQMRAVVTAIRLSEDADDWWQAGLLSRAVRLYEKSLTSFSDAYCIQSRLALRYNELGDFTQAAEHYRRAFELMPESFGRVESHCFGCEGAFNGERVQGVAEKVFSSLAERMPDRAQVFYLFGYLRATQERESEAANLFRTAVRLDPDYLNAWGKLQDLSSQLTLPAEERLTISLAILRLDPLGRHVRADFDHTQNLRALWTALRDADARVVRRDTSDIYPLAAARELLTANARAGIRDGSSSYDWTIRQENLLRHFTELSLMSSTGQLIEATLQR